MKQSLFAELKRRHVYRVTVAYVIAAWVLLQLASIIFPMFGAPDWVLKVFLALLVLGFPIAGILAWAFEITPEGVRRTQPEHSPAARAPEQHRKVGRTLDFAIIGVLAVAVTLLAWRLWGRHAATPTAASTSQKSIAVLPFENLSTDKSNGYFADGMQDLILTKLADIGDLKVISRTSTMQYGSHPQNLKKIGEELGVATLLEGSVQKAADSVLVNVQLINAQTDAHIWAQSYTRTLDNVFSVEGEVAGKIADSLKAKLSPAETRRLATALSGDADANDLFLRGENLANRGDINYDTSKWKQAIGYYGKAIAKVPDFAQARARLSYVQSALAWFGGGGENVQQLFADARAQAEQALKLAPDLADAHLALGYSDYYAKADYAAALKDFAAALALRPNGSDALAAQGYVLRRQANFDDAIVVMRKAVALDPRNTSLAAQMGITYMQASRFAEAEKAFKRALALDPANSTAMSYDALAILFGTGDLTRAMTQLQGEDPQLKLSRVSLLTYARKYSEALTVLQSIVDTPDTFSAGSGGPKSLQLANLLVLSGDSTKAHALYAEALPQTRAQYAAQRGSPIINQALALVSVAQAELGLGQTEAGLADVAKLQAIAENSKDHSYGPAILEVCAVLYSQAGQADKAVRVLSAALTAPGIGYTYSPVMLWIDPAWDPIRKDPGFQALLKKYAKDRPAKLPEQALK